MHAKVRAAITVPEGEAVKIFWFEQPVFNRDCVLKIIDAQNFVVVSFQEPMNKPASNTQLPQKLLPSSRYDMNHIAKSVRSFHPLFLILSCTHNSYLYHHHPNPTT